MVFKKKDKDAVTEEAKVTVDAEEGKTAAVKVALKEEEEAPKKKEAPPSPPPPPPTAEVKQYRVKKTATISLKGQMVTFHEDKIVSAASHGPAKFAMMQSVLDLEEV